uniref:tRNA-splicing endonuclease subunit Sen54 isoform X2 n=1 Tax=Geotrypetes seraphini TaxID=260995 RepID=A0A6P8SQ75_GEOSA|nr:tRNA-splicing endonuclease subunit Sen54 isoform X2 [Geotrypetes seraphini]
MEVSAGLGGSRTLSPAELHGARTRNRSLPQRSHGPKEFLPDNSEEQNEKLRLCREEEWQLLSEERVERLGNLVKAEWKPREGLVELRSPAGKFWQTMGFTEQGKQCLLPEEAVYMLECGSIQLFYRELPLSIQEAYERLLSHKTVTLLQYQVYSHLKRLGYIVMRFNPCSVLSPYERQLNLESHHQSSGRLNHKRKRSSSSRSKNREENQTKRIPANDEICGRVANNDGSQSQLTSEQNSDWTKKESEEQCPTNEEEQTQDRSCAKLSPKVRDRPQSRTEDHISSKSFKTVERSKWDFVKIAFPNCAFDCSQTLYPKPYKDLLPENIAGQELDVSYWRLRVNQQREKLSRREREQLERECRYKKSVNADRAVRQCCSWQEYKQLLEQRNQQRRSKRPPHLWNDVISPLVQSEKVSSSASLLEQISILRSSHILDGAARPQENTEVMKIDFDVYQADAAANFKKSSPGKPYVRMCVRRFEEQVPDLRAVKQLTYQSEDVPVVFALVDNGDIAFYAFKDFKLPTDMYH